jgi:hypothetical protein
MSEEKRLTSSDIPQEVMEWFLKQEEEFTIFRRYYGIVLITGGALPEQMWECFERGDLRAFLDKIGYKDKDVNLHLLAADVGNYDNWKLEIPD